MALLPIYGTQMDADGRRSGRLPGWLRRFGQLAVAGVLSLLVIWALFAFEWGPFRFVTEPLMSWNSANGPMPTFWAGIEQKQKRHPPGRPPPQQTRQVIARQRQPQGENSSKFHGASLRHET